MDLAPLQMESRPIRPAVRVANLVFVTIRPIGRILMAETATTMKQMGGALERIRKPLPIMIIPIRSCNGSDLLLTEGMALIGTTQMSLPSLQTQMEWMLVKRAVHAGIIFQKTGGIHRLQTHVNLVN